MYGCVTKVSEYPNQTRYAEKTEPRVPMTLWSIESSNHKHEMKSQCQNRQGGYAPVWMHHLRMGKLSMQNDLWKVSARHKLSSHKIIINDEWAMPQCKHLQIKHQWEEYNQYTSSDQNGSLLLKVIMVTWREYLTSSKKTCPNVN